LILKAAK
jgi:SAM-dependent methyltransferase